MPPLIIVGIIGAVASVATAGIGAVAQSSALKDDCSKDCKEKCKAETGWLFSGRQKCIKECRAQACVGSLEPPAPPPATGMDINWWYVIAGVLIGGSILLLLFGKGISPAKK